MENLSHHRSVIPVEFDGVFLALIGRYRALGNGGVWHLAYCALTRVIHANLKWTARHSCPILSLKFAASSFLGLRLISAHILWISLHIFVVAS
jgi:hypothetical protein